MGEPTPTNPQALAAEVASALDVWHRYTALRDGAQAELMRREQAAAAALAAWQANVEDTERAREDAQRYAKLTVQARQYLEYQTAALEQLRQQGVAQAAGPGEPQRRLPTAVILQGTGALMILAATVLAFGIAWTVLPPAWQATLMILIVFVLGGLTLGLRRTLPTTSLILAALTSAVAVAVAAFLPTVAGFAFRWYPVVAAAVVTATLAVAGRYSTVLLWRHLAWVGVAGTLVLCASTLSREFSSANEAALVALIWAGGAAAMLGTAARMRRSDMQTATTARWAGLALSGFALLAAIAALLALGMDPGVVPRLLPSAAIAALMPMLALALPHGQRTYALLPSALAVDVLLTPVSPDSPWPALVLPVLVAGQLAIGEWALDRGVDARKANAWAIAALASALATLVVLGTAGVVTPRSKLWLTLVALAIAVGAVMVRRGWRGGSPVLAYAGAALASLAWLWTYAAGHLPPAVEFFTVPVLVAVVGTQYLVRGRLWPLPAVLAGSVLALPSYGAAITEWGNFERFDVASWMWWGAILAAAAGLGWSRPPSRTVVAVEAVLGALLFGFVTAANAGWDVPEIYIAMASLGLFAGLSVAHFDGYIKRNYTPVIAAAAFMFAATMVVSVITPLGVADSTGTIRVLFVLVAWWTAAALVWPRPKWCLAAGAGALAFTWWQLASLVASSGWDAPFEVYTWSAAAVVAAVTWLALRLPHGTINTAITMAPTVTLVLVPTAVLGWWDGSSWWRVWFVVLVGGAVLALGAKKGWAGLLWPSLLAIAIVIFPILSVAVSDLPVFIPLTIMGALLILAGVRFEKLRLQGRHLARWATHLH